MLAKNVTSTELYQAVRKINEKYYGNVIFNREPELIGKRLRFTLKIKNSRNVGARVSQQGRRMASACWHVHGDLFEALFTIQPEAVITAGGKTIDKNGGNWEDQNIGSQMYPLMHSDACKCE